MITKRDPKWVLYSYNMNIPKIAEYFMININTAIKYNAKGYNLATIYDAMKNIKTLNKRKKWLYALNKNDSIILNPVENWLDTVWSGYIQRLEYEEQLKEEQYESGNTYWKLNKGFRG